MIVIPRKLLTVLVYAWPVLVVAFAVIIGGAVLAQATGDAVGGLVLRWIAMGILLLAAVDLVLLVGVLGLKALADSSEPLEPLEE